MKRETGERLLDAIAHLRVPHLKIRRAIHEIEGDEERAEQSARLVEMLKGATALLDEVCNQYPEFDPIGKGEDVWFQLEKSYETEDFPAAKLTPEGKRSAEDAGERVAADIRAEHPDLGRPEG